MATIEPVLGLEIVEGQDYIRPTPFNNNARRLASVTGNPARLETADKTNLVAAINEARRAASSPAPRFDDDTLTWWEWDMATLQFVDTGRPASAAIDVVETITLLPDDDANVQNVGTNLDVELRFSIPRGKQGVQGDRGETGDTGPGLIILGRFETIYDLRNAYPIGNPGDAWTVGDVENNTLYIWGTNEGAWVDTGPIGGVPEDVLRKIDENTAGIAAVHQSVADLDASDIAYEGDAIPGARDVGAALDAIPEIYVPKTQRGAANGIASLDGDRRVPISQIEESGPWYPLLHATDAAGVFSGTYTGWYVRRGTNVSAWFWLQTQSWSGAAGNLEIRRLPYVASSASFVYYAAPVTYTSDISAGGAVGGLVARITNVMSLVRQGGSNLQVADFLTQTPIIAGLAEYVINP